MDNNVSNNAHSNTTQDLEQMKNTIAGFVKVMKVYAERIQNLETEVKELKDKLHNFKAKRPRKISLSAEQVALWYFLNKKRGVNNFKLANFKLATYQKLRYLSLMDEDKIIEAIKAGDAMYIAQGNITMDLLDKYIEDEAGKNFLIGLANPVHPSY